MDQSVGKEAVETIDLPSDLRIVQRKGKDLDPALFAQIIALLEASYPVFDEKDAEDKRRELLFFRRESTRQKKELGDETFFLALDGTGKVIGFLNCAEQSEESYIYWMVVDERFRTRGIARKMHEAYEKMFVDSLRTSHRERISQTLTCDDRNPILPLYERMGYRETACDRHNPHKRNFVKA